MSLEYDLCLSIWKQLDQGKEHQLWRQKDHSLNPDITVCQVCDFGK